MEARTKIYELEIKTIKKVSESIESPSKSDNKLYYDAATQTIIIDEDLQNQSLTLELYDIQGKAILKEANVGNAINITHLSNGVYLYRLLENSQTSYLGKILKNN
jgi:hypothetical protein